MYELKPETADDWWEVEALYDLCFAPGRELLSSYRLRDGIPPMAELGRVARDELGVLAGVIRFWPIRIGEAGTPALLLGPVAVHPTRQSEGLGGALIRAGLRAAAEHGWDRIMLVGDAPYYNRFGFTRLDYVQMPPPTNPDRVLGYNVASGVWDYVSGPVRRWTD